MPRKKKETHENSLSVLRPEITNSNIELVDDDEIEVLSLSEYQRAKDRLAEQRKQIMLQLDGQRLRQTIKIMNSMDVILDRILEPSYIDAETGEVTRITEQGLKFLAEAYDRLSTAFTKVSRLDSVDMNGTSARINIEVRDVRDINVQVN